MILWIKFLQRICARTHKICSILGGELFKRGHIVKLLLSNKFYSSKIIIIFMVFLVYSYVYFSGNLF